MNGMPGELRLRDVPEASALRLLAAADLRALLPSASVLAAAEALWAVEGDPEAVLPVLLAALEDPRGRARRAAAEALGRLGPAGRPGLPGLRWLTRSADRWEQTSAAQALWRVAGEPATAVEVLSAAWPQNPHTRHPTTALTVRVGPAGRAGLPALRRLTRAADLWERTSAAQALWRVAGEPETGVEVLSAAWAENPHTRHPTAALTVRLGPAGTPLHGLLRMCRQALAHAQAQAPPHCADLRCRAIRR